MRALGSVLSWVVIISCTPKAECLDAGKLCVQVLDPMGNPLPSANIVASRQGETVRPITVMTDPKGWACVASFVST